MFGEGTFPVPTGFLAVGATAVPAFDTAGSIVGIGVYPDLYIRGLSHQTFACPAEDLPLACLTMFTKVTISAEVASKHWLVHPHISGYLDMLDEDCKEISKKVGAHSARQRFISLLDSLSHTPLICLAVKGAGAHPPCCCPNLSGK